MTLNGFLKNPAVRQAVQGGIAVSLSIVFGSLLSGRRWYWAALSAFIVAIGVGSRSEALIKALQRLGGTLIGIVVGIGLATAIAGHTTIAWVLIIACVFGAFYAFQQAYSVMVFFITLMVALLYGMLGHFKPELLVLRLEETAVGGLVGALVTYFVLPLHSEASVRQAADGFLEALAGFVDHAGQQRESVLGAVRELQGKAQTLRGAIGPVKRGWAMLSPPGHRLAAHSAMYCAFLARELSLQGDIGDADRRAILQRIGEVRARIDRHENVRDLPACEPPKQDAAAALWVALERFGARLDDI